MSIAMDSPPAQHESIEEKERKLRLRNRVLNEIISSEESYITQLEMLLNVSRNVLSVTFVQTLTFVLHN
jgi:hypothetical protein